MSFAMTIAEHRAGIDEACTRIERGGSETDLRELRALLVEVLTAAVRDPGLEAAAEDLYAGGAAAIAGEVQAGNPRVLRLFREAKMRFDERVETARQPVP